MRLNDLLAIILTIIKNQTISFVSMSRLHNYLIVIHSNLVDTDFDVLR